MQDNVVNKVLARRLPRWTAVLGSVAVSVACTTAPAGAPEEASAPAAKADEENTETGEADVRSASCLALDAALQTELERLGKGDPFDSVLVWSSEACRPTFLTVGPAELDEHRLFRIGSLTKTYVAVLALSFAGEGRLALEDRVDHWLPDMPEPAARVTVRQLLQHTSGLFNYTSSPSLRRQWDLTPEKKYAPRELVDVALAEPAYFEPGEGWQYTNTGYILLGMVLEAAGKAPIADLLREHVLAPNGLEETFFDGGEPITGELAPGRDARGRDVTSKYDPSGAWAAGAMVASPVDAARFVDRLGQGLLLPATMQAELTAEVEPTGQSGLGYGLGVFVAESAITGAGERGVGHGGDIFGYHTWAWTFPEKKVTLFAGVDSDEGSANAVVAAALGVLFPPGG